MGVPYALLLVVLARSSRRAAAGSTTTGGGASGCGSLFSTATESAAGGECIMSRGSRWRPRRRRRESRCGGGHDHGISGLLVRINRKEEANIMSRVCWWWWRRQFSVAASEAVPLEEDVSSGASATATSRITTKCSTNNKDEEESLLSRAHALLQSTARPPSARVLADLARQCARHADLPAGRLVHAAATRHKLASHLLVGTCLMDMYVKCRGALEEVAGVLERMPRRDVVAWTVAVGAHAAAEGGREAEAALCAVYPAMREDGVSPNARTLVYLLRACGAVADEDRWRALGMARAVHAEARRRGLVRDAFVANTLVSVYARCGSVRDARAVFDDDGACAGERDVVAWNAVVAACAGEGGRQGWEGARGVYVRMREAGVSPDARTLVTLAHACAGVAEEGAEEEEGEVEVEEGAWQQAGKVLQAEARRRGVDSHAFVGTALVGLYGRCGSVGDAWAAFERVVAADGGDVVAWSAMLAAHVQAGEAREALALYAAMLEDAGAPSPDVATLVSVVQACGLLAGAGGAHAHDGDDDEDSAAAGVALAALGRTRAVHARIATRFLLHVSAASDTAMFVASALITAYGKCGAFPDALLVLRALPVSGPATSAVPWNAMLAAYASSHRGGGAEAAHAVPLYRAMVRAGVLPTEATLLAVLQACAATGDLATTRHIHATAAAAAGASAASTSPPLLTPAVYNTLVHAYGRCGSMPDAAAAHAAHPRPSTVTWNALLAGHARAGAHAACLAAHRAMRAAGFRTDAVTALAVLAACAHAEGALAQGLQAFEDAVPCAAPEHFVCAVDMVARAGRVRAAAGLAALAPPAAQHAVWLSVLAACARGAGAGAGGGDEDEEQEGVVEVAEAAFRAAVAAEPRHSAAYVVMGHVYAAAGRWAAAREVVRARERAGAWKACPGCTWMPSAAGGSWLGAGEGAAGGEGGESGGEGEEGERQGEEEEESWQREFVAGGRVGQGDEGVWGVLEAVQVGVREQREELLLRREAERS